MNLVTERLGGDKSHFLDDPLVGVEVEGQLSVVLLDDHPSCLLDSLRPDASHSDDWLDLLKHPEAIVSMFEKNIEAISTATNH